SASQPSIAWLRGMLIRWAPARPASLAATSSSDPPSSSTRRSMPADAGARTHADRYASALGLTCPEVASIRWSTCKLIVEGSIRRRGGSAPGQVAGQERVGFGCSGLEPAGWAALKLAARLGLGV